MGGMRIWALVLALVAGVAQAGPSVERLDAGAFPRVSVKLAIAGATAGSQPTVGDLAVKEDGQPVADVQLATDSEPIWISMVVDQSGSMQPAIADLKKASKMFVDEAPSGFRMELVLFGNDVQRKVTWSPARGELSTAIDRIEPYGATALMDALQDGILSLDKVKDGRRVLVAFTDGRDQNAAGTAPQSRATAKQVVTEAKRAGVPLYLIGLGAEVNKPLMQKMAAITGGRFFHAPDRGDLSRIYREVALLLRASFELTYMTPKPATDGTVRTVEITSNWAPSTGVATARYRAPRAERDPKAVARGGARDRIAVAYTLPKVSENAEAAVLHALEMKLNASSKTAVNSAITALTAAETAAAAGGTALVLGRANALAAEKAVRDAWLAEDAILAAELARVSATAARAGRAAVLAERAAFLSVWAPWRLTVYRSLGFATAAVDEASRAVDRARQASATAHLATDAGLKSASDALLAATEASIIAAEGAAVGAVAAQAATDAARQGVNAAHTGLNAGAAGLDAGAAGLDAARQALEAGDAATAAGADATRAAEDAAAAAELGAEHAGDALDNASDALGAAGNALGSANDALNAAGDALDAAAGRSERAADRAQRAADRAQRALDRANRRNR